MISQKSLDSQKSIKVVSAVEARHKSSAFAALVAFSLLFALSTRALVPRDRLDMLVAKLTPEAWCPRFEKFLVSSANPEILILSSSTGLVPSQLSDVKNAAVKRPASVLEMHSLSQHYEMPSFFLLALSGQNSQRLSAAHMGIPAANVSDYFLLLKNSLAFGKNPETVIFVLNPREFLVPPNATASVAGSPIKQMLGDLVSPSSVFRSSRFAKQTSVLARWSRLTRLWNDERFYLAYEGYLLTRNLGCLHQLLRNCDLLHNRMARDNELDNRYDPSITNSPSVIRLNPAPNNVEFRNASPVFIDAQFAALKKSADLLHSRGIKLLIVTVPLYPGVSAPPAFARRYDKALSELQTLYGVNVFDPESDSKLQKFDYGHFEDLLHLNALGGEIMYWRLAKYLAGQ